MILGWTLQNDAKMDFLMLILDFKKCDKMTLLLILTLFNAEKSQKMAFFDLIRVTPNAGVSNPTY